MAYNSDKHEALRRARVYTRKHPRDNKDHPHNKHNHHQPPHSDQSEQHHGKSKPQGQEERPKSQGHDDKSKEPDNKAKSAPQPAAAIQAPPPTLPPAPLPLPVAQNTASQPSISIPSPVASVTATRSVGPEGTKPSVAVIAGAVLSVVVFLLVVGSIVAYKCSQRKKRNAAPKPNCVVRRAGPGSHSPPQGNSMVEKAVDMSFSSYGTCSQIVKPVWTAQGRSAEVGMESEHVSLSMSPPRWRDPLAAEDNHPPRLSTSHKGLQQNDSTKLANEHEQQSPCAGLLSAGHRISFREGETTCEGDDTQIDRCLSYYMKRRTHASIQPPPLPVLSSPLPRPPEQSTSPPAARDRSSRKSFRFPKTANLFEKIRRSQLRLNDEALSKARGEAFRNSVVPARISDSDSQASSPSRYDQTSSSIPAHWRSSTKLDRNEELADEAILGSSPHSAFEYADYYDSYLPGSHNSARLQPGHDEIGESGFALPWQNDSPCRSSALSPRRSTTTVSVRQRSATFSQASPCLPPSASPADNDSSDRRGHQSHLSTNNDRESIEAGEVIRF